SLEQAGSARVAAVAASADQMQQAKVSSTSSGSLSWLLSNLSFLIAGVGPLKTGRKASLTWEEGMPKLLGFSRFAALLEEQISDKISRRILSGDQGMVVWWSIGAGVHVEPHSHPNEQILWMLKGKMEFRLGSEQRVCSQGDVVVIPGGTEHEAWFREDT